jgi:hypothetical protein
VEFLSVVRTLGADPVEILGEIVGSFFSTSTRPMEE